MDAVLRIEKADAKRREPAPDVGCDIFDRLVVGARENRRMEALIQRRIFLGVVLCGRVAAHLVDPLDPRSVDSARAQGAQTSAQRFYLGSGLEDVIELLGVDTRNRKAV